MNPFQVMGWGAVGALVFWLLGAIGAPGMVYIAAFFLRGEVVWIKDFEGEVKRTIAYTTPLGRWCRVFWATGIGHCVLLDDGTVDKSSSSSYVKVWHK